MARAINEHTLSVLANSLTSGTSDQRPAAGDLARSECGPKSTKYTDPFGLVMAPVGVFGELASASRTHARQVSPQRVARRFVFRSLS